MRKKKRIITSWSVVTAVSQRSLRIPDTVNEGKIEARFDKGVLKVVLPKRPEAAAEQRKIEIKKS